MTVRPLTRRIKALVPRDDNGEIVTITTQANPLEGRKKKGCVSGILSPYAGHGLTGKGFIRAGASANAT